MDTTEAAIGHSNVLSAIQVVGNSLEFARSIDQFIETFTVDSTSGETLNPSSSIMRSRSILRRLLLTLEYYRSVFANCELRVAIFEQRTLSSEGVKCTVLFAF